MKTYETLNDGNAQKVLELEGKIELLEVQKMEMREAFEKVKAGKEKQLKDIQLTFFTKRKELVEKYNSLNAKYEKVKGDCQKELSIKDVIIA